MKKSNKILALVLALGMTAGFVACGGNEGGDSNSGNDSYSGSDSYSSSSDLTSGSSEGQEVDQNAWNAAFAALVAADNVQLGAHIQYEDEDFTQTSIGSFYVADGKFYNEGMATVLTITMVAKEYVGAVDGVYYTWDWNELTKKWDNKRLGADADDFIDKFGFTALGALVYMDSVAPEMIGYDDLSKTWGYTDLYESMTYDAEKQAYVTTEDEKELEIKIVDGKVASFYASMMIEEAQGYYIHVTEKFTFSYGQAVVGDLPEVTAKDNNQSATVVIPAPGQTGGSVTEE